MRAEVARGMVQSPAVAGSEVSLNAALANAQFLANIPPSQIFTAYRDFAYWCRNSIAKYREGLQEISYGLLLLVYGYLLLRDEALPLDLDALDVQDLQKSEFRQSPTVSDPSSSASKSPRVRPGVAYTGALQLLEEFGPEFCAIHPHRALQLGSLSLLRNPHTQLFNDAAVPRPTRPTQTQRPGTAATPDSTAAGSREEAQRPLHQVRLEAVLRSYSFPGASLAARLPADAHTPGGGASEQGPLGQVVRASVQPAKLSRTAHAGSVHRASGELLRQILDPTTKYRVRVSGEVLELALVFLSRGGSGGSFLPPLAGAKRRRIAAATAEAMKEEEDVVEDGEREDDDDITALVALEGKGLASHAAYRVLLDIMNSRMFISVFDAATNGNEHNSALPSGFGVPYYDVLSGMAQAAQVQIAGKAVCVYPFLLVSSADTSIATRVGQEMESMRSKVSGRIDEAELNFPDNSSLPWGNPAHPPGGYIGFRKDRSSVHWPERRYIETTFGRALLAVQGAIYHRNVKTLLAGSYIDPFHGNPRTQIPVLSALARTSPDTAVTTPYIRRCLYLDAEQKIRCSAEKHCHPDTRFIEYLPSFLDSLRDITNNTSTTSGTTSTASEFAIKDAPIVFPFPPGTRIRRLVAAGFNSGGVKVWATVDFLQRASSTVHASTRLPEKYISRTFCITTTPPPPPSNRATSAAVASNTSFTRPSDWRVDRSQPAPVFSLSISPCFRYLLSGHADGRIVYSSLAPALLRGIQREYLTLLQMRLALVLTPDILNLFMDVVQPDLIGSALQYPHGPQGPQGDGPSFPLDRVFGPQQHILPVAVYAPSQFPVWCVQFHPLSAGIFASGGREGVAYVHHTAFPVPQKILVGHQDDITCLEWHPNGLFLFTGSEDRTCRMWDVLSGAPTRLYLPVHLASVTSLAVSPTGRLLASGDAAGDVRVWDLNTGSLVSTLRGHAKNTPVDALLFSHNGRALYSVSTLHAPQPMAAASAISGALGSSVGAAAVAIGGKAIGGTMSTEAAAGGMVSGAEALNQDVTAWTLRQEASGQEPGADLEDRLAHTYSHRNRSTPAAAITTTTTTMASETEGNTSTEASHTLSPTTTLLDSSATANTTSAAPEPRAEAVPVEALTRYLRLCVWDVAPGVEHWDNVCGQASMDAGYLNRLLQGEALCNRNLQRVVDVRPKEEALVKRTSDGGVEMETKASTALVAGDGHSSQKRLPEWKGLVSMISVQGVGVVLGMSLSVFDGASEAEPKEELWITGH